MADYSIETLSWFAVSDDAKWRDVNIRGMKGTVLKGVTGQQFWNNQKLSNSCTVEVTDYT
jgi:hypothetical protein